MKEQVSTGRSELRETLRPTKCAYGHVWLAGHAAAPGDFFAEATRPSRNSKRSRDGGDSRRPRAESRPRGAALTGVVCEAIRRRAAAASCALRTGGRCRPADSGPAGAGARGRARAFALSNAGVKPFYMRV